MFVKNFLFNPKRCKPLTPSQFSLAQASIRKSNSMDIQRTQPFFCSKNEKNCKLALKTLGLS